jgi:hypothetical protein
MGRDLSERVKRAFPYLSGPNGFTVMEDQYYPDHFGNEVVVVESSNLRLRFTKDRGNVGAEIGSWAETEQWYPLSDVVDIVMRDSGGDEGKGPYDFDSLGSWLGRHLPRVLESLSGAQYKAMKESLERLAQARVKKLFERNIE